MMTEEEAKIVRIVYSRFMENEDNTWTGIDDNLELFEYLNNEEIIAETRIRIDDHSRGVIRCKSSHDQSLCFAPKVLEAAQNIVRLYDETGKLHPKNKYVLTYYNVMAVMKLIYVNEVSSAV